MSENNTEILPTEEITGEVDVTGLEDTLPGDPDQDAAFDINSFAEDATWDDLAELRGDTAGQLVSNMILLDEVCKQNSDIITDGSELSEMVSGLMLAYSDIGDNLMEITAKHSLSIDPETNIPVFQTGKVDGIDDQMAHLSIASEYTTLLQQIGNLAAVGYLDVVTAISVAKPGIFSKKDLDGMQATINTLTDEVNTAVNTATGSVENV